MRASGADGHLHKIALITALEKAELTAGMQTPAQRLAIRGIRPPDPSQEGMGPLHHIGGHYQRLIR